jgi:aminopeptidase YwaD
LLSVALTAQPTTPLPPGAERAFAAVSTRFDRAAAMQVVEFMDQYWRLAANPGYDASLDHIKDRLTRAGFGANGTVLRVEEFANGTPGWDHSLATVTFAEGGDPIFERTRDRVALCINSVSTPDEGIVAPLVDVGRGTEADFAKREVRGAVVLGDAAVSRLWQSAVKQRGAVGVISTEVARYVRPADEKQFTREEQKDVLQWGGLPYEPELQSFGFKASWRAAKRMRDRLAAGPVSLRVTIKSAFYSGPNRTLVAEIPGRERPNERIVMAAHLQEPGANDNASGSATQFALAAALLAAIRAGALPPPGRTLTFLWLDEIRGSRNWLAAHKADAAGVRYMFAMDMTGEDVAKTGGTFLIEKQADPSAVWPRPSDPHSEWGAGEVKAESLQGSLLNDLHRAVCLRRARDTGWVVRTNPYEGGSDHTVFGGAAVPSLLNWHFTDRYYHTNQDRPDKVSAAEMENVGVSVAASAWFLASADERDAIATVDLIARAAQDRLTLERTQDATPVILDAWKKWYAEALDSAVALPVTPASAALRSAVDAAKRRLQ